jgi:hypothetical protein
MDVRAIDATAAARWLEQHFTLRYIPKGQHLENGPKSRPYQVGHEREIELLIRSGIWASLGTSTQRIIPVLLSFAERRETSMLQVQISYRGMQRYSGVRSRNAVSGALRQLEDIGWLERPANERGTAVLRDVGSYVLTPYSDTLMDLANAMAAETRAEIAAEREIRRQERIARRQALEAAERAASINKQEKNPAPHYSVNAQYSQNTVVQINGTRRIPPNLTQVPNCGPGSSHCQTPRWQRIGRTR